ncbi:HvfC family RiPP maturation protein [Kaarinaea lacus]
MTINTRTTDNEVEIPAFQKHQFTFTATIRSPEQNPTPAGIEERRMNVYRELVYNNIEDLLANFFPVVKQITPESRWHDMVRSFVANHRSKTPIFMKLAEEFVEFLQTEFISQPTDPVFLVELAHYEWMEIALDVANEEPEWHLIAPEKDLGSGAPYLSPLAWPLHYQHPVHRISPDNLSAESVATHLLVYRDSTDEVQFMETNPVTAHLISKIKINMRIETKATGMQLLQKIAEELHHPNPDVVIEGGLHTMREWRKRDILLGTYK